jgi:hypothetical protein
MLFSHSRKETPVTCNNMGEPREHYFKWNKPDAERQIPHNLTYTDNIDNIKTTEQVEAVIRMVVTRG